MYNQVDGFRYRPRLRSSGGFSCVLVVAVFCCRVAFFSFLFCGSPQAAFYILQHSKTMSLRFRQQCQTAQAVAEMLEAHEKVEFSTETLTFPVEVWSVSLLLPKLAHRAISRFWGGETE